MFLVERTEWKQKEIGKPISMDYFSLVLASFKIRVHILSVE